MCCCLFAITDAASGGSAILQGGDGRHSNIHDGSHNGGSVVLAGGNSDGPALSDSGGSINITAGESWGGDGGSIVVSSGSSAQRSSE